MSIPGAANPLLLASAASTQYTVSRSLRFNASDSGYCSRTFTSAGNRKTWTWAGWVKRGKMGYNNSTLFYCRTADSDTGLFQFRFGPSDRLDSLVVNGWATNFRVTNALFRDASAWYHIVLAFDSTQASDANRCKIYVNGVEQTFSTSSAFTQNADYGINQAATHNIGVDLSTYFDGYLADIHFIDGQALTPSSFTEVSATTGQLIPKKYTGTFTGNSFWLQFADNSAATATTLGKDSSGLGNNWTPNNLSVTAGAGNDSLVDTPTSYGTDTGAGGEVRGNYCTWNPLLKGQTGTPVYSNGNLDASATGNWAAVGGTVGIESGKWYWETTVTAIGSSNQSCIGLLKSVPTFFLGYDSNSWGYFSDGRKFNAGSGSAYGSSYGLNDVIGVAFDRDNGTLVFYKNGVSQGTAYTGLTSGVYFPATSHVDSSTSATNFGQRPFAFPVSGFKALCDTNLPAPVVAKSSSAFDAITWTGNGSSQSITLPGGFSPDLVWLKQRNGIEWHGLFNTIVGATTRLFSNSTNAEATNAQTLTAFNSNGFSVGNTNEVNGSGSSYVAWCWDAGSSTVTNTQGSITSSVRANTSAGFSVATWTGTGSGSVSVGHGLGVAPQFFIVKDRSNARNWLVYHVGMGATRGMQLNLTTAQSGADAGYWNNTAPTSTVATIGTYGNEAANYVGYFWTPVSGYSSMGSFVGNGSTDGPFVYTGFRPRFVCIKSTGHADQWITFDAARNSYNVVDLYLLPNSANAEPAASAWLDFTSNGFKIRTNASTVNLSSGGFIYFAFAELPLQYARAR